MAWPHVCLCSIRHEPSPGPDCTYPAGGGSHGRACCPVGYRLFTGRIPARRAAPLHRPRAPAERASEHASEHLAREPCGHPQGACRPGVPPRGGVARRDPRVAVARGVRPPRARSRGALGRRMEGHRRGRAPRRREARPRREPRDDPSFRGRGARPRDAHAPLHRPLAGARRDGAIGTVAPRSSGSAGPRSRARSRSERRGSLPATRSAS